MMNRKNRHFIHTGNNSLFDEKGERMMCENKINNGLEPQMAARAGNCGAALITAVALCGAHTVNRIAQNYWNDGERWGGENPNMLQEIINSSAGPCNGALVNMALQCGFSAFDS